MTLRRLLPVTIAVAALVPASASAAVLKGTVVHHSKKSFVVAGRAGNLYRVHSSSSPSARRTVKVSTITAVDTTARTLTVTAAEDSTKTVTIQVPASFDITKYAVGETVDLHVTQNADGTYTLADSSEDGDATEANDPKDCQGHDHGGDTGGDTGDGNGGDTGDGGQDG